MSLTHELDSMSIAPIEASSAELDLIEDVLTEGVEHDHEPDATEPDDETIVTELKVMHTDESYLFVPVEALAYPVITPCLSQAMKKLEIDGTRSGKVLSTVTHLQVDQDELQKLS